MSVSKQFWQLAQPIYQEILQHPFNRELADGTLALSRFQFYLKQDSLYLVDFAKALLLLSERSKNSYHASVFKKFGKGAVSAEQDLHQYYFATYDITRDIPQSPGCFAYTNYLLATISTRTYEEGVAAVLPCFWIYRDVGQNVYRHGRPNNPYQKWIDTYGSQDFAEIVDLAIQIMDEVAAATTEEMRLRMAEAFLLSARLEWVFWDSAYREETWESRQER